MGLRGSPVFMPFIAQRNWGKEVEKIMPGLKDEFKPLTRFSNKNRIMVQGKAGQPEYNHFPHRAGTDLIDPWYLCGYWKY